MVSDNSGLNLSISANSFSRALLFRISSDLPIERWNSSHCSSNSMRFGLLMKHEWFFTKPRLSSLTCAAFCNKKQGNDASLRAAMMPIQWGRQHHCGSRATMPLLRGRQHHLDYGKDVCASTTTPLPSSLGQKLQSQQWKKPCASMATMPLQCGWWHQLDIKWQGRQR